MIRTCITIKDMSVDCIVRVVFDTEYNRYVVESWRSGDQYGSEEYADLSIARAYALDLYDDLVRQHEDDRTMFAKAGEAV